MSKKFRGIFVKFTDKTSSVTPTENKDGKKVYPKITLMVKVSNNIPPKHRICR